MHGQELKSVRIGQAVVSVCSPGDSPELGMGSNDGVVTGLIEDRWGVRLEVLWDNGRKDAVSTLKDSGSMNGCGVYAVDAPPAQPETYSQNENTRRNARLCDTPFFSSALNKMRQDDKTPAHLPGRSATTAEFVERMEIEAKIAVRRFLSLSKAKKHRRSDDIQEIMLAQEYYSLRDIFMYLHDDMTNGYFAELSDLTFHEILSKDCADRQLHL